MPNPDYIFWSVVGLIAVVSPSPWHWRVRNIVTLSLIFWIALGNLVVLVNTILWYDNYADRSPTWCDISGRIKLIEPLAIAICSLVQMRKLAAVASTRSCVVTATQRKRMLWGEGVACIGLPVLTLPIFYVLQGHRYNILESDGCEMALYPSWPGYVMRFFLPIMVALGALIYASLAIRSFLTRRMQFRSILAQSDSNLNISRYVRLIALACTDVFVLLFTGIFTLVISLVLDQPRPYISWSHVHNDYGVPSQFPLGFTPLGFTDRLGNASRVLYTYSMPLYSITFFIFFGLGDEAIKGYLFLGGACKRYLVRWGILQNSHDPSANRLPSLGSKVVRVEGSSWGIESLNGGDAEDGGEKMFSHVTPRDRNGMTAGGIPVSVERSIV